MNIQEILDLARAQGVMIATAESCTGGMVSVALTDLPGSSSVLERGVVTYSNDAKKEQLGVSQDSLNTHGAVSEQIAREMAEGALDNSHADLAISVTGIAGPGGSEHKPEGRVCFGLARNGLKTFTETKDFGAQGRAEVRRLSCDYALSLLKRALS